jgi:hypothetical protein
MMSPQFSWLSFKACATASLVATGPVCEVWPCPSTALKSTVICSYGLVTEPVRWQMVTFGSSVGVGEFVTTGVGDGVGDGVGVGLGVGLGVGDGVGVATPGGGAKPGQMRTMLSWATVTPLS